MSSMRLKLIGASDDAFCARDPFILALEDGSLCVPGKRRSQTAADPCRSLSYLCASAMSSIASEAVIPFHHENELIYPTRWLLYLHIYTSLPLTHTVQYSTIRCVCLYQCSAFCCFLPQPIITPAYHNRLYRKHYHPIVLVCIVTGHLYLFSLSLIYPSGRISRLLYIPFR